MAKGKISSVYLQGQTDYQKQQAANSKLTKQQKFDKRVEKGAAELYFKMMFPKKGKK